MLEMGLVFMGSDLINRVDREREATYTLWTKYFELQVDFTRSKKIQDLYEMLFQTKKHPVGQLCKDVLQTILLLAVRRTLF